MPEYELVRIHSVGRSLRRRKRRRRRRRSDSDSDSELEEDLLHRVQLETRDRKVDLELSRVDHLLPPPPKEEEEEEDGEEEDRFVFIGINTVLVHIFPLNY